MCELQTNGQRTVPTNPRKTFFPSLCRPSWYRCQSAFNEI